MAVYKTIDVTTSGWVSVNNTGDAIGVGTSMKLQSQVVNDLKIIYSSTQPADDEFSGELVTNLNKFESSKITPAESDEVWVRVAREGTYRLKLFVQEWTL